MYLAMFITTWLNIVAPLHGCHKAYRKGSGIQFYRFTTDPERRSKWIAAVSHENWQPNEYSWLCSKHFVSGKKSNNPSS